MDNTPHNALHFLYIPETSLVKQDQACDLKFFFRDRYHYDEHCIKPLRIGELAFQVCGTTQNFEIIAELKTAHSPARLLIFSVLSDNKEATLLITGKIAPHGIHLPSDKSRIFDTPKSEKGIPISFPEEALNAEKENKSSMS